MTSLKDLLQLKCEPVAIYRADSIPEDAHVGGEHCCIPPLLLMAAKKGRRAATDMEHIGCHGSVSGLGFGKINLQKMSWSYSTVPKEVMDSHPRKGDGKHEFCCPEVALAHFSRTKEYEEGGAIVFEPLDRAEERGADIEVVVFLTDPVRISALSILAGFERMDGSDPVKIVHGLACQQIYVMPKAEGEKENPCAILGFTDLYARRFIGKDEFSFSVPYRLYKQMEMDAPISFLTTERWKETLEKCA